MYLRKDHAEPSLVALRQLIRDNPLGQMTTAIAIDGFPLLQSSHIPFVLEVDDETSETDPGRLIAHMAKANPQAKAMHAAGVVAAGVEENSPGVFALDSEVLVTFTSDVQHYVTPQFYTETKPSTAKVVPTWNYATAHVRGRATLYVGGGPVGGARTHPETNEFLAYQLDALSDYSEKVIMGYDAKPWKVADAPAAYLDIMRRNIVGLRIDIDVLEGKFKMSQEMSEGDRAGVIGGFKGLGSEAGTAMAALVADKDAAVKAAKAAAKEASVKEES
ncbi:hypothetical protein SBRCBS47491_006401 [Sporothrix bragantina]|uniref:Transcriptional regulator n=1 Tax=Sporothrix bragantina TaxID=671064 RepID=A0ABP0C4M1_9PEZI